MQELLNSNWKEQKKVASSSLFNYISKSCSLKIHWVDSRRFNNESTPPIPLVIQLPLARLPSDIDSHWKWSPWTENQSMIYITAKAKCVRNTYAEYWVAEINRKHGKRTRHWLHYVLCYLGHNAIEGYSREISESVDRTSTHKMPQLFLCNH